MDIIVADTAAAHNNEEKRRETRQSSRVGYLKDRRRVKLDRRRSIRDGISVSFSFKKERRSGRDRRHREP